MSLTQVQLQWAEALRSGKYQQGQKQLRRGRKHVFHCCLGVLCELAKQAGIIRSFGGTHGYLPDEVTSWAGLATTAGDFKGFFHDENSLVGLNDARIGFNEIAEFIESEPKGLFVPAEASHA